MEYYTDSGVNKVIDLPYFEGDLLQSTIEDLTGEVEVAEVSDNKDLDDSFESEEPTKVRQIKFLLILYYYFINNRTAINVNCVGIQHIRRRISKRRLVNVELLEKMEAILFQKFMQSWKKTKK